MLKDKDPSNDSASGGDTSQNKLNQTISDVKREKGIDFMTDSEMGSDGFQPKPSKTAVSGSHQELTLSYLCDNSKLCISDKDRDLLNSLDKVTNNYKGKEIVCEDQTQNQTLNQNQDNCGGGSRWIERDFLQLSGGDNGNSSKRDMENAEVDRDDNREKKPKLETLNLSLALPDVSLSLAASNPAPEPPVVRPRPSRSVQSLAPSNNNTQTTYSNDFTAASWSYSHSHAFSHNPSCSLTRNSTDYEYSMGSHRRDEQIWNAGEGTNGSVHSRFRPVGDGVAFANHGGGGGGGGAFSLMQGNNNNNNNSIHRTASSDNISFFPSELPARPALDTQSGDSRGKGGSEHASLDGGGRGGRKSLSRPERVLREIVSESVPLMSQIIQELPDETIDPIKEHLKSLIATPEKREELVGLQSRLERRSDLTKQTLLKAHRNHLVILVSLKMGLASFLSKRVNFPIPELVEIFLLERCRNVNCKRALPVEDCDCKICSTKKGFCSECMCPVCLNFDCASNTCSWVGCDVCSHWCHAACGIQKNLIKPGPSLKGPSGTTEMQFHCLGCGHASEMFGFVKDVFMACAKDWGLETMIKELDCVRKVFRGSEDYKGMELHIKADEMVSKLESKAMSPSEVCTFIFQFFNYTETMADFPSSSAPPKELPPTKPNPRKESAPLLPSSSPNLLPPKSSFYPTSSANGSNLNMPLPLGGGERIIEDEWSVKSLMKKDGFDSLESIVRIKEAEARMFQSRADEARRDSENYRRMVRMKSEKLEEEYAEKLAKLCLRETEERRTKKLEELKALESSQFDYYKMKMRMQTEIAGLLQRMEATKQQMV